MLRNPLGVGLRGQTLATKSFLFFPYYGPISLQRLEENEREHKDGHTLRRT